MKKLFKIVLLIGLLNAQYSLVNAQNLVPNPSFEDTVYCPCCTNQIEAANGWMNFGNTPDYYNACVPSLLNVPNSQFGYQYANTGVGMAGVVTYVWELSPGWPDYREFMGTQLLNPLSIGQKYYLSFYLNFTGYLPGWQKIGADKLGIKFSTVSYSENTPPPLNNSAHLFTDSIYIDTVQWVKVSGSFIADSSYNHLIIGNFFDSSQTDTMIFGGPPFGGSSAYYNVDDVCVTTDSLYNEFWTGINKPLDKNDVILIFPNPSSDFVNIESKEKITQIQVINLLGEILYSSGIVEEKYFRLPLDNIQSGMYLIYVKTEDSCFSKQVSIIN